MKKSDIKILVLEDDANFSKVLSTSIEKAGYSCSVFKNPKDAISSLKLDPPRAMIVDCLLPQMSGVDFLLSVAETEQLELPTFLMSGIYNDKAFVKDSLQKTKALQFFSKPFEIKTLIEALDNQFNELVDAPLKAIEEILFLQNITRGECIRTINETKSINLLDLPRFIHLFLQHKIEGKILVKEEGKKDIELHFCQGKICSVRVDDPQSYYGALLVEQNYITHEEMEMVLQSPGTMRLGEKLIKANLLSPHVIDIINAEQLAIRLSRVINNTNAEIVYEEAKIPDTKSAIDMKLFTTFLIEWISSKYSKEYLELFYLSYMNNTIVRSKELNDQHPIFMSNVMMQCKGISEHLASGSSISSLLALGYNSESLLSCIHLLIVKSLIHFDKVAKVEEMGQKQNRLQKIWNDMQKQDYFQIMGVSPKARDADVKSAFHNLAKLFHPDKLSPGTPAEIVNLTKNIFAYISKAYEVLSNETKKLTYQKELEHGKAQVRLEAEAMLEEAKQHLHFRRGEQALKLLEVCIKKINPSSEMRMFYVWAKLSVLANEEEPAQAFAILTQEINKVPPEDRHNATYYFVKALMQKQNGELDLAKGNLKHAISLEPNFIEAKRELNILNLEADNKPVDLLHGDLKDIMGSLFNKKKKR